MPQGCSTTGRHSHHGGNERFARPNNNPLPLLQHPPPPHNNNNNNTLPTSFFWPLFAI
eukprot:NODE_11681_length_299_cov_4.272000_g10768_i0.p3 GENE.NODE_11681_length_299_cov_4.272000_g10768_i0~~NODE_11681_length_299_cov_4.272000_g10768_i0.p3  ORF type:complete len:58 (+),score=8.33 NODE_11681_length_299_cov_4.272000_g10768_i0:59-232(+)